VIFKTSKRNTMADITEEGVAPEVTTEVAPDTENEAAETSQSSNEEIIEVIKQFYPDADVSSDQAIIGSALKVLNDIVPIHTKTYDVVDTAPEVGAFLSDVLETGDIAKAIARNFDPQEFQALCEAVKDDDDYEGDRAAFADKVTKAKERKKLIESNKQVSLDGLNTFMEERKDWSPEKAEEFHKFVLKHYEDSLDGLITMDNLAILEKGFKYDQDVASAEEVGTIKGRNEQIVTKNLSKEEKENLLPEHASGKTPPPPKPAKPKNFGASFLDGAI
jgi:hypothetical protein